MNWTRATTALAAVVVTVSLGGCVSTATDTVERTAPPVAEKGPIVVGSKIDTEGKLLGAMIIAKLRSAGFRVVDKTQTGATDVVRQALLNGEIDIYPEYTGSGYWFYNDSLTAPQKADFKNGAKGYALVKQLDAEKYNVTWLEPARANNTWALAVRQDFATANNLTTMSDLGAYVKSGKTIKVAASEEFFNNADAWPAFAAVYGFDIPKQSRITLSGGDTAQTEKAVSDATNGVNVGMAYGTDGALSELGLTVLVDDRGAQLVYWPTPIARAAVTDKYPEIASELAPVFDALTLEKLQELNGRIQANGESAQAVADDFLRVGGFIK